jgi:hypothetical protein
VYREWDVGSAHGRICESARKYESRTLLLEHSKCRLRRNTGREFHERLGEGSRVARRATLPSRGGRHQRARDLRLSASRSYFTNGWQWKWKRRTPPPPLAVVHRVPAEVAAARWARWRSVYFACSLLDGYQNRCGVQWPLSRADPRASAVRIGTAVASAHQYASSLWRGHSYMTQDGSSRIAPPKLASPSQSA